MPESEIKFKKSNTFKKNAFSLVEILISIAILALIASAVGYLVLSPKKKSQKISQSSVCTSYAQTVIDTISSLGVRDNILPPHINLSDKTGAYSYLDKKQYQIFSSKISPHLLFNSPIIHSDNTTLHNSHLILSAATFLETLYNSDSNYCTSRAKAPESILGTAPNELVNVEVFLTIKPTKLSDGKELGCSTLPLISKPKGTATRQYAAHAGDIDVSYDLTVNVDHNDANGDRVECSASARFQHQMDTFTPQPPKILFPITMVDGTQLEVSDGGYAPPTSCNTKSLGFRDIRVRFTADLNSDNDLEEEDVEAGSVFVCSADNINFVPCHIFKFSNQTGSTEFSLNSQTTTIDFHQLEADREYYFYIASVDTAGNMSESVEASFIVDATRPGMDPPQPIILVGPPEENIEQRLRGPETVNWGVPNVQCMSGIAVFEALQTGSVLSNTVSCIVNASGTASTVLVSSSGNPPSCWARVRSTIHGSSTLRFRARDVCGDGDESSITWPVVLSFNPQPLGHVEFENSNSTEGAPGSFYSFNVPAPSSAPSHYAQRCDCINPASATNHSCAAKFDMAPNGCTPLTNNLEVIIWDICGRTRNIFGSYEVHGDASDPCGTESCKSGKVCSQANENSASIGICYDPSSFSPAECTPPAEGNPPSASVSNCTQINSIFDCSYTGSCIWNSRNISQCGIDKKNGETCVTTVIGGTCNTTTGVCEKSDCFGGGPCSSALGACSVSGACSFSLSGICSINSSSGSCSPKSSGPVIGGPSNPSCPKRGPHCWSSGPTTTTTTTTTSSTSSTTITTTTSSTSLTTTTLMTACWISYARPVNTRCFPAGPCSPIGARSINGKCQDAHGNMQAGYNATCAAVTADEIPCNDMRICDWKMAQEPIFNGGPHCPSPGDHFRHPRLFPSHFPCSPSTEHQVVVYEWCVNNGASIGAVGAEEVWECTCF